jgi:hypothetical protein
MSSGTAGERKEVKKWNNLFIFTTKARRHKEFTGIYLKLKSLITSCLSAWLVQKQPPLHPQLPCLLNIPSPHRRSPSDPEPIALSSSDGRGPSIPCRYINFAGEGENTKKQFFLAPLCLSG